MYIFGNAGPWVCLGRSVYSGGHVGREEGGEAVNKRKEIARAAQNMQTIEREGITLFVAQSPVFREISLFSLAGKGVLVLGRGENTAKRVAQAFDCIRHHKGKPYTGYGAEDFRAFLKSSPV